MKLFIKPILLIRPVQSGVFGSSSFNSAKDLKVKGFNPLKEYTYESNSI
jgi:hypothetical protein